MQAKNGVFELLPADILQYLIGYVDNKLPLSALNKDWLTLVRDLLVNSKSNSARQWQVKFLNSPWLLERPWFIPYLLIYDTENMWFLDGKSTAVYDPFATLVMQNFLLHNNKI